MIIEDYHFGSMTVRGEVHESDVQIFPSDEIKSWWRKTSHEVFLDDIEEVWQDEPEIIIFGTGSPGMMTITDEVKEKIKSLGIEMIIEPTKEAVERFNELKKEERRVAGFFHLTC